MYWAFIHQVIRSSVFIAIALILLFPVLFSFHARASDDLHTWQFTENGAFLLEEGWYVYRDQYIDPVRFQQTACGMPIDGMVAESFTPPDLWGPGFTTSIRTGHGKATYCINLMLPDDMGFYSVRMGALRSVSHIYAVFTGGKTGPQTWLLNSNGDLDETSDTITSNPTVPLIDLPHGFGNLTLVMQLSNRVHKQGGMIEVPKVDLKWRLVAESNRATALPSALVIVLLFVAAAALVTGRKTKSYVDHRVFAFVSAAAALRAAFVSDLIWDYLPSFPLGRKYDLEYLSLFLIAISYYALVTRLLRPGKVLIIDYLIYGVTGSLVFFALFLAPFFEPGTITLTREPIQIIWSVIIISLAYVVLKTTITDPERRQEAITIALAAVFYAAYEIGSTTGVLPSSLEWSQFVIFLVIMMHAQAFAIRARRTELERNQLMAQLEDTNRDLQNRAMALDLALKRAEDASKAKSNFLATFSHELRTPLNAIIGFSELMGRELFGKLGSSHYMDYVNDINSSGRHLLSLVDDILDLSRIEAGADDLSSKTLDVCALIEEVLGLLSVYAMQKKVKMAQHHNLDVPFLRADERKLKQILLNIITNAIKFNEEKGKIDINVHADETGLYIDVIDTGIGIEESDIPIVLSRFGQADSSKRKKDAGVGIGLPLSEVLMRQHGGTLKVTSEFGKGTCVALWFPPDRIEQADAKMLAEA